MVRLPIFFIPGGTMQGKANKAIASLTAAGQALSDNAAKLERK